MVAKNSLNCNRLILLHDLAAVQGALLFLTGISARAIAGQPHSAQPGQNWFDSAKSIQIDKNTIDIDKKSVIFESLLEWNYSPDGGGHGTHGRSLAIS